jgi:hypothetical protein
MVIALQSWVLRSGGRTILVDTGALEVRRSNGGFVLRRVGEIHPGDADEQNRLSETSRRFCGLSLRMPGYTRSRQ